MRGWLKEKREEKKLSQQNVAERLEITQQYFNLIENGERKKRLDLPLILKLSEILDVSVDFIIAEEMR